MATQEWKAANIDKMREYRRNWYERNKSTEQSKARVRGKSYKAQKRAEYRQFIIQYKKENPCIECGESDFRCLDFNHIDPTQKHDDVSALVSKLVPLDIIKEEISKCNMMCANCHRKHHFYTDEGI